MALEAGTTLGPYRIDTPIGAGGMGEVYKATDTRLDRTVAIKVLPAVLASNPERRERFEREAKTISSLQHPHICTLHDVGHQDGIDFLVMEHLEGETLQDRLAKGALPLDQALRHAIEIADALDKAHRQGIVHRDLKPGNIMLTKAGAKLLDFGLAKLRGPAGAPGGLSARPTQEANLTAEGSIVGTFHYMAPEQLDGGEADHRTDIWAFGCVVYEMVTRQKAFEGKTQASLIGAILRDAPRALSSLQPLSPPILDQVVQICMAKDPDERWQSAGDVGRQLKLCGDGSVAHDVSTPATIAKESAPGWLRSLVIGAASLLVGALAVWTATRPAQAPVTRLSIVLPEAHERTEMARPGVAVSADGRHVAYVANEQLYVRALGELEARPVVGTEGTVPISPFFSPDGEWIAFRSPGSALMKVPRAGGTAVPLAEVFGFFGGRWQDDDTILFSDYGRGILRVADGGGTPELLVPIEPEEVAGRPQMLPGGEVVLFTLTAGLAQWDTAQIVVENLATGERKVVLEPGSDAHYLPTGHLIFTRGQTLLAAPFDVRRLEVTGGPVPVVEGVGTARFTGGVHADVAQTGALVYQTADSVGAELRSLVWVDREGNEEPLPIPPREYAYPRLSPDGTRILLDARDEEDDLWIWHFGRQTLTRLTFAPERDWYPVWTPDGNRVVFASSRDGSLQIHWRAADGSAAVEALTAGIPNSVSPDGTQLIARTSTALNTLTLDGDRRLEPLLEYQAGSSTANAEISPDGAWLAYQSDVTGRLEIYVQPFPDVDDGRWQISTAGGTRPLWSPDGAELFYMTGEGVMGVKVDTADGFALVGTPALIVEGPSFDLPTNTGGRTYDISRDGQRFLMLKDVDPDVAGPTQIVVVQNWHQELLERVPVP